MPPAENCGNNDDGTSRRPLARMPSGDLITASFLSEIVGHSTLVGDYLVDEGSVIEGRHSTTFRLLLLQCGNVKDAVTVRQGFPTQGAAETSRKIESADATYLSNDARVSSGENEAVGVMGNRNTVISTTASSEVATPTSLFVKRVICSELPSRSLRKWRCGLEQTKRHPLSRLCGAHDFSLSS